MPPTTVADRTAILRGQAMDHTTVRFLVETLPELNKEGPNDPGLYVDADHVPGLSLNGVTRVSVARVVSVTPKGSVLVGQVQVSAPVNQVLLGWDVHLYIHEPESSVVMEMEKESQWWTRILDYHYSLGGPPIEMPHGVEA